MGGASLAVGIGRYCTSVVTEVGAQLSLGEIVSDQFSEMEDSAEQIGFFSGITKVAHDHY